MTYFCRSLPTAWVVFLILTSEKHGWSERVDVIDWASGIDPTIPRITTWPRCISSSSTSWTIDVGTACERRTMTSKASA